MTPLSTHLKSNLVTDGVNKEKNCVVLTEILPLATRTHQITGYGKMWLLAANEGIHWDFVLLDESSVIDGVSVCEIVFEACGPRGGLHELRHMHVNPAGGDMVGYLNYPDLLGISQALKIMHDIMEEIDYD